MMAIALKFRSDLVITGLLSVDPPGFFPSPCACFQDGAPPLAESRLAHYRYARHQRHTPRDDVGLRKISASTHSRPEMVPKVEYHVKRHQVARIGYASHEIREE
jgi:hypothetical protein